MNDNFSYRIFVPGGNDTALVMGIIEDIDTRHRINDKIMRYHKNVEQVGFISLNYENPRLLMAGGEFCGNATRSAAWFYLNGKPGEIEIAVSGVSQKLKAGVTKNFEVWAEMPINKQQNGIEQVCDGYYIVKMEGITHLVITPRESKSYLADTLNLKLRAKELLKKYDLISLPAAGVIFIDQRESFEMYSIHPCVYVSSINTMFYETACGSGTIAAGLVLSWLEGKSVDIPLVQPSGKIIHAIVDRSGDMVSNAVISGPIYTDDIVYKGD